MNNDCYGCGDPLGADWEAEGGWKMNDGVIFCADCAAPNPECPVCDGLGHSGYFGCPRG
jgi:hypothetical protein